MASPSLCTPKHKGKKKRAFDLDTAAVFQRFKEQDTFIIPSLFILFCPVLPERKKENQNASINPTGISIPLTPRQIDASTDQCKKHFQQVFLGMLIYLCAEGYFPEKVSGSKWPL